jgi:hypothetical protein
VYPREPPGQQFSLGYVPGIFGSGIGVVTGRFHVAAIAVRLSRSWWAVTRPDIREHLPQAGRGARVPGTGRLERVWILTDPGVVPLFRQR